MNDFYYIGIMSNTHGLKGEIRIICQLDIKDRIFKLGNKIYFGDNLKQEVIKSYRVHKNYDMITLDGLESIDEVLEFKGQKVYGKREDLNLTVNEYLLEDLLSFEVYENDELIGKVIDIYFTKNNTLIKLDTNLYIPLYSPFIDKIIVNEKRIYTNKIKELMNNEN